MLPRFTGNFVSRWLGVTLVLSIITALEGGHLAHWLALSPAHIFRGQVWRLVTWPLIERGPLDLIFTCAAIYKFGGELAVAWGDLRLRRFVVTVTLIAGAATCVVALISPWPVFRSGGWALSEALVIAWARQFPDRTLVVYQFLRLRGRDLARFTLLVAAVYAIYTGPATMMPELAACTVAYVYRRR